MKSPLHNRLGARGFSLIEMLAAAVVFAILGALIAQLLSSATQITGLSNKKQAADAQARLILGRMGLDFGKMLKRSDLEYNLDKATGNDRMSFVAEVTGYYPSTGTPGSLSVVAYRMGNATGDYKGLERLSKGLSWLGDTAGASAPIYRRPISQFCPEATSNAASDEYEEIGPGVIRLEYFFQLKNGKLSDVPWDVSAGHSKVDGLRDVAAIGVAMAVVDPSVLSRVTPEEMRALAAKLRDFSVSTTPAPGDLERAWQQAVDSDDFTRKSGGSVRIHSRYFPIDS